MSLDRILFVMPEFFEDVLFCMPVGQTHSMYGRWKLDRTVEESVVCKEEYEFLLRVVFPHAKFYKDTSEIDLQIFDAIVIFDRQRAYLLGEPTKKMAVDAYAVICGSAPQMRSPVIGQKLVHDGLKIVFAQRSFADYRGRDYVYPFAENRALFEQVFVGANLVEVTGDMSIARIYDELSSAEFVFGVVGGSTLLASAMMKPVLEIYPEKSLMYREWAAKWSTPFYRVLAAELEQVPPDFLAMTFDKFIGEVVKKGGNKWRSMTRQDSIVQEVGPLIPTVP